MTDTSAASDVGTTGCGDRGRVVGGVGVGLVGGDACLDEASAAALPAILQREGRTLVVATHDVERGKAIADRIVTLERGRVVSA